MVMVKRKGAAPEGPVLSLPTEPTTPVNELGRYSMLLYGLEKIGKTSLAAQFPDAFFLLCEPGGKALSIYGREVKTWADFKGYLSLLDKSPGKFKTVVVDTVDIAFKLCEEYMLRKMGITHESDEEWGKGWSLVRNEFALSMARIINGPRGVVFISHATEKKLKRRDGRSSDRIVPTMPSQARAVLEPMVDIWSYYQYDDGGKRILTIRGDDFIAAGHRCKGHFVGVSQINMGNSAEEGYNNYVAAFDKTAANAPANGEKGGEGEAKRVVRIVRR